MKGIAAFGWLAAAFGAFAAVMVLVSLGKQTAGEAESRFIASAALSLAGVVIARRARRAIPQVDPQVAEREILRVVRAHNGRVTATEVATETIVPLAQASQMLEALSRRGMCRMSIAEAGIMVFEFPELETAAEASPSQTIEAARAAQSQRTPEGN